MDTDKVETISLIKKVINGSETVDKLPLEFSTIELVINSFTTTCSEWDVKCSKLQANIANLNKELIELRKINTNYSELIENQRSRLIVLESAKVAVPANNDIAPPVVKTDALPAMKSEKFNVIDLDNFGRYVEIEPTKSTININEGAVKTIINQINEHCKHTTVTNLTREVGLNNKRTEEQFYKAKTLIRGIPKVATRWSFATSEKQTEADSSWSGFTDWLIESMHSEIETETYFKKRLSEFKLDDLLSNRIELLALVAEWNKLTIAKGATLVEYFSNIIYNYKSGFLFNKFNSKDVMKDHSFAVVYHLYNIPEATLAVWSEALDNANKESIVNVSLKPKKNNQNNQSNPVNNNNKAHHGKNNYAGKKNHNNNNNNRDAAKDQQNDAQSVPNGSKSRKEQWVVSQVIRKEWWKLMVSCGRPAVTTSN